MLKFPIRVKNGCDILSAIFPTKQADVQLAIELAKNDSRINRLIVFGSAITLNCGMTSDIDIAIDTSDISFDEFINVAHPFFVNIQSEVDIIHYNDIHSDLLKQNVDKGVCVYVKQ